MILVICYTNGIPLQVNFGLKIHIEPMAEGMRILKNILYIVTVSYSRNNTEGIADIVYCCM